MSSALLHHLGFVVLQALWELAVLGLLAWAALGLLRRRSPRLRYAVACGFLLAMVLVPLVHLLQPWLAGSSLSAPAEGGWFAAPVLFGDTPALRGRVRDLAPFLAWAWMLGSASMLVRMGAGFWWLERRYLAEATAVPGDLQARLDHVARRLGLHQRIRLLASRRAASPLLLGWLKPVVLVPSAAFLHLAPEALEAVLAHELAHLRRRDPLVNLLQGLAEALLFFHPCAWWLSARIRDLREHCCDDEAAALCGDPLPLAEGLAALERLRRGLPSDPSPALAAAKGKLMHRITRLFAPEPCAAPAGRALLLALTAASLLGAGTLALQQEAPKREQPKAAAPSKEAPVQDVDFSRIKVRHQPPPPAYPAEAKEQRIQGTVVVELRVDETGVPIAVKALEGPEALQATAIAYAKDWRFEPLKVKGKPVQARFRLTMPFRLR